MGTKRATSNDINVYYDDNITRDNGRWCAELLGNRLESGAREVLLYSRFDTQYEALNYFIGREIRL